MRKLPQCLYQSQRQKRQQGQPVRGAVGALVQMSAQRIEFRDIDLLDVRKMRNLALGGAHALRNDATQPDDFDLRRAGRGCHGGWHGCAGGLRFQVALEIRAQNSPARAAGRNRRQFDSGLFRAAPNRRRRNHA